MKEAEKQFEKREAILCAMLELITERGFHATPMSLVAERAGVAAGTIYHHFDSKEAIINEIYAQLRAEMGAALLRDHDPNAEHRERFARFWNNLFGHFIAQPAGFLFLEQYANSPYIEKHTREEHRRDLQPLLDFLEEGTWSGVLRNVESGLLLGLVYGSVACCVKLQLSGELQMSAGRVQQAIQASWDSIRMD